MSFDGTEAEQITLVEAAELTANYRDAHPAAIKGEFFGKDIIQNILDQGAGGNACMGIRVYYGQANDGTPHLVMVGVTADENDITSGILAERARPCPPYCSNPNPLNSDA